MATETKTAAKPRTRKPPKAKQVEETVRSYFEAADRHDLDAMVGYYDSDAILDVAPIGVYRGIDGYRSFFADLFAALPDCELVVTRLTAGADGAAVEWRLTGTFDGEAFQGLDPNGRRVELRGCDCIQITDGKITRNTVYYDGLDFARGVGMMPGQDSSAEKAMKQAFNAVTKVRRAVAERGR